MCGTNKDPSKLSDKEFLYLQKHGVKVSAAAHTNLIPENYDIARVVAVLAKLHPANPVFDVSIGEIVAALNLYNPDADVRESIIMIADTFQGLNTALNAKPDINRKEPPVYKQ